MSQTSTTCETYYPKIIECCIGGWAMLGIYAMLIGIIGALILGFVMIIIYLSHVISFTPQGIAIALIALIVIGGIIVALTALVQRFITK
jgi:hypothetical protein